MPLEAVPLVQKRAIELARIATKPVIVATQVMDSMIRTRAQPRAPQTAPTQFSTVPMRSCCPVRLRWVRSIEIVL